jgi:hypothetical protein
MGGGEGGGRKEGESGGSTCVKYTSPDGRPYYHNTQTGKTSWTLPSSETTTSKAATIETETAAKQAQGSSPSQANEESEEKKVVDPVPRDAFGVPIRAATPSTAPGTSVAGANKNMLDTSQ